MKSLPPSAYGHYIDGKEVLQSHEELIWPEKIVCGHPEHIAKK